MGNSSDEACTSSPQSVGGPRAGETGGGSTGSPMRARILAGTVHDETDAELSAIPLGRGFCTARHLAMRTLPRFSERGPARAFSPMTQ